MKHLVVFLTFHQKLGNCPHGIASAIIMKRVVEHGNEAVDLDVGEADETGVVLVAQQ